MQNSSELGASCDVGAIDTGPLEPGGTKPFSFFLVCPAKSRAQQSVQACCMVDLRWSSSTLREQGREATGLTKEFIHAEGRVDPRLLSSYRIAEPRAATV